ncbi:hypothetical protein OUZ56_013953 [Daphnia magna]|uniref:Uncharacterized protein n=1 Tax=Daphnia magna TaxID=35525 RepID=A0ABQ9Z7F4_9CRUS|nr:hypothetical protein OUZ56_013953 [Daphnia magna]
MKKEKTSRFCIFLVVSAAPNYANDPEHETSRDSPRNGQRNELSSSAAKVEKKGAPLSPSINVSAPIRFKRSNMAPSQSDPADLFEVPTNYTYTLPVGST